MLKKATCSVLMILFSMGVLLGSPCRKQASNQPIEFYDREKRTPIHKLSDGSTAPFFSHNPTQRTVKAPCSGRAPYYKPGKASAKKSYLFGSHTVIGSDASDNHWGRGVYHERVLVDLINPTSGEHCTWRTNEIDTASRETILSWKEGDEIVLYQRSNHPGWTMFNVDKGAGAWVFPVSD